MITKTISSLSKINPKKNKSKYVSKQKKDREKLTIAKSTTQDFKFKFVSLNLQKLCWDVIEEIETTVDNYIPIDFTWIGKNNNVILDTTLIYPILLNLLANAVKYSQATKQKINLKAIVKASSVTFIVEDKGIGVPLADQAYVFKSFYRGQNTDKIDGLGIGLAIVQRCVDLHQGKISFESTLGKGSKFTVCIPLIMQ